MKKRKIESCKILIGGFAINFLIAGIIRIQPLLYVEFLTYYNTDRKMASLPFALCFVIRDISGPIAGYLAQIFGLKLMISLGCLLSVVSTGACYFADDIIDIVILCGVLLGFGVGFAQQLLYPLMNQQFPNNISKANGFVFSGASLGGIVMPSIMKICNQYYDLSETFLILSSIMAHAIPASFLLKSSVTELKKINPSKPPITTLLSIQKKANCKNSLVTYTNEDNDRSSRKNHEHLNFIDEEMDKDFNFMEKQSQINIAPVSVQLESSKTLESVEFISEQKHTKLNPKAEQLMKDKDYTTEQIKKNARLAKSMQGHGNLAYTHPNEDSDFGEGNVSDIGHISNQNKEVIILKNLEQRHGDFILTNVQNKEDLNAITEQSVEDLIDAANQRKESILLKSLELRRGNFRLINDQNNEELESMEEQSEEVIIYTKNKQKEDAKLAEAPDQKVKNSSKILNRKLSKEIIQAKNITKSENSKLLLVRKNLTLKNFSIFFDLAYIAILFICSNTVFTVLAFYTIIIDCARDKGVHESYEIYFVYSVSIADFIGRLGSGFLIEKKFLPLREMTILGLLLTAISISAFALAYDPVLLLFLTIVIFLLIALVFILQIGLVVDFMEEDKQVLAQSSKFLLTVLLNPLVPSMIGYFRITHGSYNGFLYLVSFISVISAFLTYCLPRLVRRRKDPNYVNSYN